MSPRDFWTLTPEEIHWIVEAHPRMYGSMTEDEVAEIYERAYG